MRLELTTPTMARLCSTTELRPQFRPLWYSRAKAVATGFLKSRNLPPAEIRDRHQLGIHLVHDPKSILKRRHQLAKQLGQIVYIETRACPRPTISPSPNFVNTGNPLNTLVFRRPFSGTRRAFGNGWTATASNRIHRQPACQAGAEKTFPSTAGFCRFAAIQRIQSPRTLSCRGKRRSQGSAAQDFIRSRRRGCVLPPTHAQKGRGRDR